MLINTNVHVRQNPKLTAPKAPGISFKEGSWSVQDAWDDMKMRNLHTGLDDLSRDGSYRGKSVKAKYTHVRDIQSQPLSLEQRRHNARKESLISGLTGAVVGGVLGTLGAGVLTMVSDLGSILGGDASALAPLTYLAIAGGAVLGGVCAGSEGYTRGLSRQFAQERATVEGTAHVMKRGVLFCPDDMEPIYFKDTVNEKFHRTQMRLAREKK